MKTAKSSENDVINGICQAIKLNDGKRDEKREKNVLNIGLMSENKAKNPLMIVIIIVKVAKLLRIKRRLTG